MNIKVEHILENADIKDNIFVSRIWKIIHTDICKHRKSWLVGLLEEGNYNFTLDPRISFTILSDNLSAHSLKIPGKHNSQLLSGICPCLPQTALMFSLVVSNIELIIYLSIVSYWS